MTRAAAAALACGLAVLLGGCPGDDDAPSWSLVLDGDDLDRVALSAWGASSTDVYVAGGGLGNGLGALALHYDGSAWHEIDTGFDGTLWWTWGAGAGDVFFVGEQGAIVRGNADGAVAMDTPTTLTLYGIWGSAATDIWAVGGDPVAATPTPVMLHYDGIDWTDVTPTIGLGGALFKVWGAGPSDVFAVGQGGSIIHYDGSEWTRQESGVPSSLFTVFGADGADVYAVGGPRAVVLHYDGTDWTEVDTGLPAAVINGVSVAPDGDVLVVGMGGIKFRLHDGAWSDQTTEPPNIDLHAVWFADDGTAIVVGGNFYAPGSPGSVRIGVVGYFGANPPATSL